MVIQVKFTVLLIIKTQLKELAYRIDLVRTSNFPAELQYELMRCIYNITIIIINFQNVFHDSIKNVTLQL